MPSSPTAQPTASPEPAPHANSPRIGMGYLVSQYPAISHTFILREVLHLRRANFDIQVASINEPDRPTDQLTEEEQQEAETTFYIKRAGPGRAVGAHLATLLRHPLAYLRGLIFALSLDGADLGRLLWNFFYFTEALLIGRWLQARRLTHLHMHFATAASSVGLIAGRIFPITLSLTVHGPDEFYDVSHYHLTEKIAGADFVCCIGTFARSQLMKLSTPNQWDKFEVSPLGIDPEIFAPRPFREQPSPFEILCVGRLVPAKGQHVLIKAVAHLRDQGRAVHLTLVGDGPDRPSLEAAVCAAGLQENVRFAGAVNQDSIRALYEQADAFSLASFAEGIPVVLMEAMAMEVPCVTTRITGIPELIRHGVDGLLVAPSDADELADELAQLMDNPEKRLQLGRQGRERVVEKYNLPRNVRRLEQIFRRRLEQKTCPSEVCGCGSR